MEYSLKKMKSQMEEHQFSFKKKYGQNFIIDENIIRNIVLKSEVDSNTFVLEIGPGAGSLTCELCKKASHVLCYEIDTKVKDLLRENLKEYSNVEVCYEDFLKADVLSKLKEYSFKKLYVVANLPYYITTPILMKLVEDKIPVDKVVVMVQKEVGDRFRAKPCSRDYGSLTVFLNYYFDIQKLFDVSRNVFLPKPNVDSIVVSLTQKENLLKLNNSSFFFKLVKDSFQQKRKNLRNNLKSYDLGKIEECLREYGYDLSVRAEQLSLEIFVVLANYLQEE